MNTVELEEALREANKRIDELTTMRAKIPPRPLLYTDTIQGQQVCRDDMWAVTTDELNRMGAFDSARLDWLNGLREDIIDTSTMRDGEPALIGHVWGVHGQTDDIREAIDTLRESEQEALSALISGGSGWNGDINGEGCDPDVP